jgi:3-methyl-2-oxobutanoate hydroxymethyltransferase
MSEQTKVTPSTLRRKKRSGEKITMLTAYDYPMAKFINAAGVDIILVSDAVGTVGLGRHEAISVSVDEMIYHTRAVRNGAGSSMVVTTLPFGSYDSADDAAHAAMRLMKEGGADGVHLEGTAADAPKLKAICDNGTPVIAHIGITKQKIVRSGSFTIQGRTASSAANILNDAVAFARAGAIALVLECIPDRLGEAITRALDVPTIGIGAGAACDGQALVTQDMLGLFQELSPRFLKVYLNLSEVITGALTDFRTEVERGQFPTSEHTYAITEEELNAVLAQVSDRS